MSKNDDVKLEQVLVRKSASLANFRTPAPKGPADNGNTTAPGSGSTGGTTTDQGQRPSNEK